MIKEYLDISEIWAKSPKNNEKPEILTEHTSNVLHSFEQLKKRNSFLSNIINEENFWDFAFLSCLFHDIGKSAKSFQIQIREGKIWRHRHEIFSLAFIPEIISPDNQYFKWIVAGVVSHHKDAKEIINERYSLQLEPEDIALDELKVELNENLVQSIFLWLKDILFKKVVNNEISCIISKDKLKEKIDVKEFINNIPNNIIIGLKIYDNLVRQIEREDYKNKLNHIAIALRGIVKLSDYLSSAHSPDLILTQFPDIQKLTHILNISENKLYSHQIIASKSQGSILLTAPTGSGKTESAILWAGRQQTTSKILRPLIYLLPYQASLNAIYKRFKEQFNYETALIHGRSLQTLYWEMLNSGYLPKDAEKKAKRAKELSMLYQPSLWCTTPYHLLRAAYKLPGYEILWANIANSLIVIDEIHAYEPTRLGIFIELLFELKNRWNVSICAMTATMPSWLKKILMITIADKEVIPEPELFKSFCRHRLEIIEGNILDNNIVGIIYKEFKDGKSILLGVNTVKTGQKLRDLLYNYQIDKSKIILLHSRFTTRDRLQKEEAIRQKNEEKIPHIVIATQVIEVSLNLDFDTIITEPAPLEALIQRFGRVNRQGKKGIVPVWILTESIDDENIYDKKLVDKVQSILKNNQGNEIDELKISKWLDEVYSEFEDKFFDEIQKSRDEFRESCLKTLKAFNSNEELSLKFDELFDNTEVLPLCLEEEFKNIYETSVIEAHSLLVPVSWKYLCKYGAIYNKEYKVNIINMDYDADLGLSFDKKNLCKAEII